MPALSMCIPPVRELVGTWMAWSLQRRDSVRQGCCLDSDCQNELAGLGDSCCEACSLAWPMVPARQLARWSVTLSRLLQERLARGNWCWQSTQQIGSTLGFLVG
eukprot:TRINITY_DN62090_c0_g1_i1.p2 TRINITY_DN62090_c0_g1~~TRINITY_DN62090_c0_g1_i1.p2  ORF type:complete len:104 (-),score=7.76 TRINITY_DN62090_c0_g1_i1:245-556(-)